MFALIKEIENLPMEEEKDQINFKQNIVFLLKTRSQQDSRREEKENVSSRVLPAEIVSSQCSNSHQIFYTCYNMVV